MSRLIIVIDDSLTIRKILSVCLRRADYEVRCFEDGLQALGWLNTSEARIPDLAIVDLGLPKLDGYEIIRMLKARPALDHTVLVILSARDGILDRVKGRLAGAHAYLTKPFRTQTILEVIQMHLKEVNGCGISEPFSPTQMAVPAWNQEQAQPGERGMRR